MKLCALTFLFSTKLLPLAYAFIGFGLLITVHECGHFLFCKLFGIHTPTFSIGLGPTLYKRKIGQTNFRVALIPIGGYVEIAGMSEVGQGEQKSAVDAGPTSFSSKPYWQRFLVLMGGVLFNLLFAYMIFSALYMVGMPVQKEVGLYVQKVEQSVEGLPDEALAKAGSGQIDLRPGDRIVEVNQHKLDLDPKKLHLSLQQISSELNKSKPAWITVGAMRNGTFVQAQVPSKANGHALYRGILAGLRLEPRPLKVIYEKLPVVQAIRKGISTTHGWIGNVLWSLKMLVTKRNVKDFGGPIMIVSQSFKMAQRGILWLFVFLAIISINLAVINLLPIGALDGGQLLFETIEAIIRRKIPDMIRLAINLASWVLILSLIMFLSYQDIRRAIFGR